MNNKLRKELCSKDRILLAKLKILNEYLAFIKIKTKDTESYEKEIVHNNEILKDQLKQRDTFLKTINEMQEHYFGIIKNV